MKKLWFKAKRYGYGWYPATWQGWLVMLVWVVLFAKLSFLFAYKMERTGDPSNLYWFAPSVFILTAVLIWISAKTGEKAKWRWNNDK